MNTCETRVIRVGMTAQGETVSVILPLVGNGFQLVYSPADTWLTRLSRYLKRRTP